MTCRRRILRLSLAKAAILAVLALVAALCVGACDAGPTQDSQKPTVVTSTTILADLVEVLGGDNFEVHSLVSAGADPHVYQPRPGDARQIAASDAVVLHGLLLEGWMEDLIRNAGGERPVIVAGEAIDEDELLRVDGAVDPHIWFDVQMWRQAAELVARELATLTDDEAVAEEVANRHAEYDARLVALDDWIREQLMSIPKEQQVIITSHDAFNYFGRAYAIDVEGIQGLSTEQEASQRDLIATIEMIKERQAPAIFTESSVNSRLIDQVGREAGVERKGPLFSDSLGPEGSGAETYVGMLEANVEIITEALGGTYRAFDGSATAGSADEDQQ